MRLIFSYADGSRELYHSGTKGMHWGQWNEETRKRRMRESGMATTLREKTDESPKEKSKLQQLHEKAHNAKVDLINKDSTVGRLLKKQAITTAHQDIGKTKATQALQVLSGVAIASGSLASLIPGGGTLVGIGLSIAGNAVNIGASTYEAKRGKKMADANPKLAKKVSSSTNLMSKGQKMFNVANLATNGLIMGANAVSKLATTGASAVHNIDFGSYVTSHHEQIWHRNPGSFPQVDAPSGVVSGVKPVASQGGTLESQLGQAIAKRRR